MVQLFNITKVLPRVHNRKREESIALAYHPCAKFSGGQVSMWLTRPSTLRARERQSGLYSFN